ncbi:MAG: hypothetical protein FI707_03755 [SAR202 cluster bacterium]|nr:hypothetical protein [Chloroflexota bacterium]MQG59520.1 hypothetical protein [SAR202 cluster bacterium]MQG67885.1 hypothetical protein [SAR202 cluster bacterium]HAL49331.1 hypothetical protein [Dehalococcoidia bacterium]
MGRSQPRLRIAEEEDEGEGSDSLFTLAEFQELVVQQEIEHLEVFTGFETENRYSIMTPEGEPLLFAWEESGVLGRQFLSSHRALEIHVVDGDGQLVMTAGRDFYWFLSQLWIADGEESPLGSLSRHFKMLGRFFTLNDPSGNTLLDLKGSLFRPNTFIFEREGAEVARITKQWGGIGRELATDADTFVIQKNTDEIDEDMSLLILACAFAIDLEFFESKGSH